ncbi:hypothetical protein IM538_12945 [Cytobacillus suaedae]|nr:hypothetical protein IM538_12945 [Cytobacillus suaedae]
MKVYDQQFNQNEWFVLFVLIITYLIVYKLPKRFSKATTITLTLLGVYIGMLADHSISIPPFDFYDVNDKSTYQVFDFLTYVMYGPFGYLFLYFYDYFDIKGFKTMLYIVFWTSIALLMEYVAAKLGVFHYKQGYRLLFSVPIYLWFQSLLIVYYHLMKKYQSKHSVI